MSASNFHKFAIKKSFLVWVEPLLWKRFVLFSLGNK